MSDARQVHVESSTSRPARRGRVIGIDLGAVRIGVASADWETGIASPMETYQRRTEKLDADYFQRLAKQEQAALFVVGLPLMAGGRESAGSVAARKFAIQLSGWTGVPVELCDERYTTAFAEELLIDAGVKRSQRKGKRDRIAAQMILTAYFETIAGRDAALSQSTRHENARSLANGANEIRQGGDEPNDRPPSEMTCDDSS